MAASRARWILKAVMPPIAVEAVRRFRRRGQHAEWEYLGAEWPAPGTLRGWNNEGFWGLERSAWPERAALAAGPQPIASSLWEHHAFMCFAYVVGRALAAGRPISILDWGGGLGQYGLVARGLHPDAAIDYHCADVPLAVATGRRLLADANFHDDDASAFGRTYDLVVASCSLHCVADWRGRLAMLGRATARYLYVARYPILEAAASYVTIQRPYVYGYDTEFPLWATNRTEFVASATGLGLVLRREFLGEELHPIPGAPEQPTYRSFLFERPIT